MAFNTGFPALFFSTAWAASLDDDDESDRTLRGGADSAAIAEALRRAGITTEENRPNAAARVFVTTPEDDSDLPALVTFDETDPYEGKVVKVMDFGAFVNFFGAKDGLVHISQLASARVQKTSDVVKEGDKVKVKLLGFDDRGKTRLSMKAVDQATGEDLEAKGKTEVPAPREAAGE